jgi:UDP-N-acetylmuramoyl-tripeptide--D-alanyl-D-alanine ligase
MVCQVSPEQLIPLLHAVPLHFKDRSLKQSACIITDTRTLPAGAIFLALRGDNFDGHEFLSVAQERGAIAAIVDTQFEVPAWIAEQAFPLLQVPDTLQAYQAIAHWWRQQFTLPVIAVTGSVGKTTTKELIAAVLSAITANQAPNAPVLKSQANYNNEIGVPKTLLELGSEHQFAIVEMGMRGRGEIALLSQIAQPNIAVITNVGTAHIGRLGSEEAIAAAKCELLAEMPSDSIAILNHDNPLLLHTAKPIWTGKTLTFGLTGGDVHGKLLNADTLQVAGLSLPLPLPGSHNALNYLAALAVAQAAGLSWDSLTAGVSLQLPNGRAQQRMLPNDVMILDETYNAGLESMLASLHLLAQTPGQRHIAILGTMKELGSRSLEFHQRVGRTVNELHLDQLLVLADAPEAEAMQQGAATVPTTCLTQPEAVVNWLKKHVKSGDRLLFKASRAVGLDRVVEQFCQTYKSSGSSPNW